MAFDPELRDCSGQTPRFLHSEQNQRTVPSPVRPRFAQRLTDLTQVTRARSLAPVAMSFRNFRAAADNELETSAMWNQTFILGVAVVAIAAGILLIFRQPRIGKLFVQELPDRPRRRLFIAAVSFALVFATARTLAWLNFHHLGPFHDIYIHGRHVHHLVWGILLLLVVGYGWLLDAGGGSSRRSVLTSRLMSVLYGAGAALTLDEFALWLNLRDVYWSPAGRASIDVVILFGAVLLAGIGGRPFFRAAGRELVRAIRHAIHQALVHH